MTENLNENEVIEFEDEEGLEDFKSILFEKGRYRFKVIDIIKIMSSNNNPCLKITIEVEGRKWTLPPMTLNLYPGKRLIHNFFIAIGIRSKDKKMSIPKSNVIGKEGYIDIGLRKRTLPDGTIIEENKVIDFSSMKDETVPFANVPNESENTDENEEI